MEIQKKNPLSKWRILIALAWGAVIIATLIRMQDFTVSGILEYTPSNTILAAIVMLMFFALKSVSIVLYSGILFAAVGLLFPIPVAVLLTLLGIMVMVTIPYLIGRKTGSDAVAFIINKYPKAARLREIREENSFIYVFLIRLMGVLPSDILSLYMGAAGVRYHEYLIACLLGMLPTALIETMMGTAISNIHSPRFMISLGLRLLISAASIAINFVYQKRNQ